MQTISREFNNIYIYIYIYIYIKANVDWWMLFFLGCGFNPIETQTQTHNHALFLGSCGLNLIETQNQTQTHNHAIFWGGCTDIHTCRPVCYIFTYIRTHIQMRMLWSAWRRLSMVVWIGLMRACTHLHKHAHTYRHTHIHMQMRMLYIYIHTYTHADAYALECLAAAVDGGVDWLVLCDTNGGSLPWEIVSMKTYACMHTHLWCICGHIHTCTYIHFYRGMSAGISSGILTRLSSFCDIFIYIYIYIYYICTLMLCMCSYVCMCACVCVYIYTQCVGGWVCVGLSACFCEWVHVSAFFGPFLWVANSKLWCL
jgi:hypothetical protein